MFLITRPALTVKHHRDGDRLKPPPRMAVQAFGPWLALAGVHSLASKGGNGAQHVLQRLWWQLGGQWSCTSIIRACSDHRYLCCCCQPAMLCCSVLVWTGINRLVPQQAATSTCWCSCWRCWCACCCFCFFNYCLCCCCYSLVREGCVPVLQPTQGATPVSSCCRGTAVCSYQFQLCCLVATVDTNNKAATSSER